MKTPVNYLKLAKDDPQIKQIRAFIAIELPEEVKTHLGKLQDLLKAIDASYAKWVSPESIHLTLKFLGNVDIDKLDAIIEVMEETARKVPPFQLEITQMGAFPNLKRVQTIWVGIEGNLEQLQSLQRDLDIGLEKLGFLREKRPFVPHLTLARVRPCVSAEVRLALGETIGHSQVRSNLSIEVASFSLVRSQLTPGGAIYSCLNSAELKGACH